MSPTIQPAPPVIRTATVARDPERTFRAFVDEIGAWWPLPSHGIFQADSGGVRFVDGQVVETATDGRQAIWAEVLGWDPPTGFVLAWHPGRDEASSSRVEVTFEQVDAGTRVQIRHDGWESFGEDGFGHRRSYVGPSAWGHVLDHFADGVEEPADGADLEPLRSAYEAFLAEADRDGFGAADPGQWGADEVLAHVALNDLSLTAVAHALIHQRSPTFDNEVCQRPEVLRSVIDAAGDRAGLLAFARAAAAQAIGAARRLDPDQRATAVPCRFVSDGEVVLEQPMPWGTIAIEIQATRHLPAHTEQLAALRG
ncbi:MAG: SRPBCC domain-containing protein [Actinomycetota bacterium]